MHKYIYIVICLVVFTSVGYSQQSSYSLSIKIESSCSKFDGTLSLHKSTNFEIFSRKDTNYVVNLNVNSDSIQIDGLERWTYMIEYSPSDTSILSSKRIIHLNTDIEIYLDCNYFNSSQQPFSSRLESGEFIAFYSPEFPNPFTIKRGNETVEYNLLVVERKKGKYLAYYYCGIVLERMYGFGVNLNTNYPISMIAGSPPQQKEINKKEMEAVIIFERELNNIWFETIDINGQDSWKSPSFYYTPKQGYILLGVTKELIVKLKNDLWKLTNKNSTQQ